MKLWQEQAKFCADAAQLITYINSQGMFCTFGDAFRSKEQAEIDARNGVGIKDSLHCERLALDLNLFNAVGTYMVDDRFWKPFGEYWEKMDPQNRWGGNFERKDGNHFQRDLPK